jgi:hypothetical protein
LPNKAQFKCGITGRNVNPFGRGQASCPTGGPYLFRFLCRALFSCLKCGLLIDDDYSLCQWKLCVQQAFWQSCRAIFREYIQSRHASTFTGAFKFGPVAPEHHFRDGGRNASPREYTLENDFRSPKGITPAHRTMPLRNGLQSAPATMHGAIGVCYISGAVSLCQQIAFGEPTPEWRARLHREKSSFPPKIAPAPQS